VNKEISGLIVKLNTWRSIYLTRVRPLAVSVEISLVDICVADQTATLGVTVSGERCDLALLKIAGTPTTVVVSADGPTEVVPGVIVAIRSNKRPPFVTHGGTSLVIAADREVWLIERAELFERRLRARGRLLGKGERK